MQVIAISKHRVKNNMASNIINKILPGWGWHTNACTNAQSRLWVIWNTDEVDFFLQEDSAQYIHGTMKYVGYNKKF